MVSPAFVEKNFDKITSGYICKKTHMYLSDDMYSILIGKRVTVAEIDADDPVLNVVVDGFNIPALWIEKKAPARRRARAGSKTAGDGSEYGPTFLAIINAYPALKGFTTNRFSKLTLKEKQDICNAMGLTYNKDNEQSIYEEIAIKFFEE